MARFIEISGKLEHATAFGVAVECWLNSEPMAMKCGLMPRGLHVRVQLYPLEKGDEPDIGTIMDDRPRAVALLRYYVPSHLVSSASVDGRDWNS